MNISTIGASQAASAYQSQAKPATEKKEATKQASDNGVVYEPNQELIAKLKNDAAQQAASLQSLVEKVIAQQSNLSGQSTNMWQFLASGNFTVDAQTKADAQAAIAEDGYWGVEQTSSRIVDFATALTGGDPEKIEEMRDAFLKGYEKATKTWGGKLPDICEETYGAVLAKFDALARDAGVATEE